MRFPVFMIPLIATLATMVAEHSSPNAAPIAPQLGARDQALDHLLAARESPKAFAAAIVEARKNGVAEQAILEARFLFHVDARDDAALAAMLPDLLKQRDSFKLEDSAIFGVKEDWLAVVEYVQAIAALGNGDKDAFKRHITEAFWLSPRQAAAFAPHIENERLETSMLSIKIDFKTRLTPLAPGEPVALDALIAGKKALLFHFWSPLSRECEAALPDFVATAVELVSKDIAVVSLLPNDSPKLLIDARTMLASIASPSPGVWLIDSRTQSLARELRIQNLPTMVLVSPEGKILFNGDPTEKKFWETLIKIDARINRPKSTHAEDP